MALLERIKSKFFPNKKKLYQSLETAWDFMGEKEPFYSVVTDDRYKTLNWNEELKKEFYFSSGSKRCTELLNEMLKKQLGKSLKNFKDLRGLDFGCGVGRNTIHLAPYFKEFVGLDISQKHLDLAEEMCKELKLDQTEFYASKENILLYGTFDLVFSVITLQHIPPPIMKNYVTQLLKILNPNGIAFLHIPIGANGGYRFMEKKYFDKQKKGLTWDMHVLPKAIIEKIIAQEGCKLIHCDRSVDLCGGKWHSALFLIQKEA